jgi:hypothetical protein
MEEGRTCVRIEVAPGKPLRRAKTWPQGVQGKLHPPSVRGAGRRLASESLQILRGGIGADVEILGSVGRDC